MPNPRLINVGWEDAVTDQGLTITLRDLFAAFSLAGQSANPDYELSPENMAHAAFQDADAMLSERRKRFEKAHPTDNPRPNDPS